MKRAQSTLKSIILIIGMISLIIIALGVVALIFGNLKKPETIWDIVRYKNPTISTEDNSLKTINNNTIIIKGKIVSLDCTQDQACSITDVNLGLSCCQTCGDYVIDYSKDNFVAVNSISYNDKFSLNCSINSPCPMCEGRTSIIDTNYSAKCINGICKKVKK
jgi:hypothetical protein